MSVVSVVLSGRGLCDGLITRPEESYGLQRVVVCDQETSNEEAVEDTTKNGCDVKDTNNKERLQVVVLALIVD